MNFRTWETSIFWEYPWVGADCEVEGLNDLARNESISWVCVYEVYPTFLMDFEQNLMLLINGVGIVYIVGSTKKWEFHVLLLPCRALIDALHNPSRF